MFDVGYPMGIGSRHHSDSDPSPNKVLYSEASYNKAFIQGSNVSPVLLLYALRLNHTQFETGLNAYSSRE